MTGPSSAVMPLPEVNWSLSATPEAVLVGAGDIARCSSAGDELTAALLDGIAGEVFTTGDNAYSDGSAADYADCYDPSWGRHKARTRPSPGNHDYRTPNASGYFGYFGAQAGVSGTGYYSYDLGSWHVISLNSEIDMSAGSPQEQWLRADLAASSSVCTVAYWHRPRFSSGSRGITDDSEPLWNALHEHHVEIVLNGHEHFYERFSPQAPDGAPDAEHGIRQFTIGTGGAQLYGFEQPLPNSEVRYNDSFGVLKLSLHAGSYQWEFVPVAAGSLTETGAGACHDGAPLPNNPPIASAGGPYASEGTVTFDGAASTDPEPNLPLSYAWDFGDGSFGEGPTPVHSYGIEGTYDVTLVVTDALGAASGPAATQAVIANLAPTVDAGEDLSLNPGSEAPIQVQFSDPGPDDAPWSYSIDWGDGAVDQGSVQNQDPFTVSHTYVALGQYLFTVTVSDKDGGVGADSVQVAVVESGPVLVGAGKIARCSRDAPESTAQLLDGIPGTVFTLGDNAHAAGTLQEYQDCYEPTWGRHKARTRPTPGSADYDTQAASGYFGYFGSAAGQPSEGYYSYDVGSWHVIALNTEIDTSLGSPQERWLRADLAANPSMCTLAYGDDALFHSEGDGGTADMKPLWDALYEAGAEVVLGAERRFYERFAPQTPDGVADPALGIREFVVGTGGWGTNGFGRALPNSEVRQTDIYGVLKLTLHDAGYDWEYVAVPGETFTDQGSGTCHGPPPNADPTASFTWSSMELAATFTDQSTDSDGTVVAWNWDFGDGSASGAQNPTHAYASAGTFDVTLTVTDDDGAQGSTAAAVVVSGNALPVVQITEPASGWTVEEGTTIDFSGAASDVEDGDLTAGLAWTSSLDGGIGTGGAVSTSALSAGSHTITASVTDGDGGTGSDAINVTVSQGGAVTFEVRVGTSSDDAEESSAGGVDLDSSDLELVFDGTDQTVGMRFTGVDIPQAAMIASARIQFQAEETNNEMTSLVIEGEATDDAVTFSGADGDLTSRNRTSSSVTWSPAAWSTVGDAGADQRTPNIAPIIQEIVDRAGWSRGNSIAIIVTGSGERVAESYDGVPQAAALLSIAYTVGSSNQAPTAGYTYTTADLGVDFTDTSTDSDGSVVSWSWDFGDGNTSSAQSPSHTYAGEGTYTVTLTVTDDGGATDAATQVLTVTAPPTIALVTVLGKVRGLIHVDLSWSGTSTPQVDIYRDGQLIATVPDTGAYRDETGLRGSPTLAYQLCEAGSSVCSAVVVVGE